MRLIIPVDLMSGATSIVAVLTQLERQVWYRMYQPRCELAGSPDPVRQVAAEALRSYVLRGNPRPEVIDVVVMGGTVRIWIRES